LKQSVAVGESVRMQNSINSDPQKHELHLACKFKFQEALFQIDIMNHESNFNVKHTEGLIYNGH
jgi:hypothetical protein